MDPRHQSGADDPVHDRDRNVAPQGPQMRGTGPVMNNVYILGGGVAGLSAAHELAERGFNVVVFEQHDICGGKARSMKNVAPGRPDLPGEHGFRFFPGFYWHLTHTMRRIVVDPLTGRTADQNLVKAEQISIAQDGRPLFVIKATRPNTLDQWITAFRES